MGDDEFEKLVLSSQKEVSQRDFDIGLLTREAWKAFNFLKLGEFEEARSALIDVLNASKTPGFYKDMEEATDRLIEAMKVASVDEPEEVRNCLAEVEAVLIGARQRQMAEINRLRLMCEDVIKLYRDLRDAAKGKIYDTLRYDGHAP